MRLEVQEGPAAGSRRLVASGEMDLSSTSLGAAAVRALVAGAEEVVLELAGVGFFDSSGVRLIDRLARECGLTGARFSVSAPPGSPARRVLELVGMASVLADA